MSVLGKICTVVLDIFLSLLIYPILFIFLSPLFLYRWMVILCVKICYPSYIPGSYLDQAVQFDYFATKGDPLIFSSGAMVTVLGPVSVSRLKERWKKQFLDAVDANGRLIYPKLSVSLVRIGGHIFFKPLKQLNAQDIFHEEELDPSDLENFKTEFLCREYKKDAPLWEVVIVKMGEETKMFYRFHHVIADGYTQLYLLNQSMKKSGTQLPTERDPEYSFSEFVRAAISLPRVGYLYVSEVLSSRHGIPLTASSEDAVRIASTHIYFSDLKTIYRKSGANFLSINLALYAAVLRRILKDKGHGDFISVQTALPWPNHPAKEGKMGNHFSAAILKLPMTEMTALRRVKEVDDCIKLFYKRRLDRLLWWFWIPMTGVFPSEVAGRLMNWVQRSLGLKLMSSTLLSFEEFEYETDGSPVMAVKPLIARCSYTTVLIASTVIYNERCEVTFVGTPAVAENQEMMNRIVDEYYLEELEILLDEVRQTDLPV